MDEDPRVAEPFLASESFFQLYDSMIGDDIVMSSVLQNIAEVARRNAHAERAAVFLLDAERNALDSVAVIGNIARVISVPISEHSLAGYCALTGRSFIVPDAYADLSFIDPRLRFDKKWDAINKFHTREIMCAPALFKGQVLGVVEVINREKRPFQPEELSALQMLARIIGYALHHYGIYNDLVTLHQLDREKAEFMRIMVHELKSPIASVKAALDLITNRIVTKPDEIVSFASTASKYLDQMTGLIKDILDLAKVKSGGALGEIRVLDILPEVRAAADTYRLQAESKGLTLLVNLPAKALPVRFDFKALGLVLSNLVSNAVKYTERGTVTISVRAEGSWVVLDVADTGIGIPEDEVPQVVREFFRASNAKRKGIIGSGVGLAMAKQLIERFGGEFAFATHEGEGSTFTVRLPYEKS